MKNLPTSDSTGLVLNFGVLKSKCGVKWFASSVLALF